MGLLDRFRNKSSGYTMQLVTDNGGGFYSWNGKLYQSDIVRSAVRPFSKLMGKLIAKHIREQLIDNVKTVKVNPDAYMRFLLEEPNPYMSGQVMQEKIAIQWRLNNNAFVLVVRDEFGYPTELYPVPAITAGSIHKDGIHYYKFGLKAGKQLTVLGSNVIHLRNDFFDNDVFGDHPGKALEPLMEIIAYSDQSRINAAKNSRIIRWLLKFKQSVRPEDMSKNIKDFTNNFLSLDNDGGSVMAQDVKFDVEKLKNEDYVPATSQLQEATQRIYRFFNVNEKIINSSANEEEMVAYFESEIEPAAMQMSNEFTRKLFTRRERGVGNRILFEASSLQFASLERKLQLVQMVDRGGMTLNEWRFHLNMPPIEGGDQPIRRLDTAVVNRLLESLDSIERGEKNAKENARKLISTLAD